MTFHLYAIGSVLLVSIIAVIAAIPLLIKKDLSRGVLVTLLSVSVGTLLGAVTLYFLPEIYAHEPGLAAPLTILGGFMVFFVLEKLIHHHHSHKEHELAGHGHAYHLAPINLAGDAIHNFIDGMVIAASYAASIPLGVAATISVLFHELPQEIADMGVLLYAGLSRTKALLYNAAAAATAILGTVAGLLLAESEHFVEYLLPFAAGMFIYIAASNLVPELHRDCGPKDTALHVTAILAGVGVMVALSVIFPHGH